MSTTVTNPVLFGLKVSFNFSDIESKTTALQNLGLDLRDLDVIRGISGSIDKVDLQNVSGLDVNLTRYLDRLSADTSRYKGLVDNLAGYNYPTKGNLEAFGPVSGGAVRYKYIPNDGGVNQNASNLKFGDISTSRVSSWSSATSDETNLTQAISYGGSVQVKGDLKIGQNSGFIPTVSECLLNVLDTPEPIRFPTEVPTDIIELNVNGTPQYLFTMRGIPFTFTTAFKSIAMDFRFDPFDANGATQAPIYTVKATDNSEPELTSKPTASGNFSRLRFSAQSYKERDVKVYFPPGNITEIVGVNINLRYLPAAKFLNLVTIKVQGNLLGEMPDWRTINYTYFKGNVPGGGTPSAYQQSLSDGQSNYSAPAQTLRNIEIHENPLYLSEEEDLQYLGTNVVERLPSDTQTINISGTYRENTTFLTADQSLVIVDKFTVNSNDFNYIKCDPKAKQTYPFDSLKTGMTVKGIFYDKFQSGDEKYVYVDEPEVKVNGVLIDETNQSSYLDLIGKTGILRPLDFRTRTPELRNITLNRASTQVLYQTSNSKYVNYSSPYSYVNGVEQTPRVNIKNIVSYNVAFNGFRLLSDEFMFPGDYLDVGEDSDLTSFNVYDNDSLSGQPDFSRMTKISDINIGDTGLEIPKGLQDKTTLNSVNCSYSRFPTRTGAAIKDTATGEGNWSNANNHFYTTKNPTDFGTYVFKGCTGLNSFSFYSSRMDGFFPKLVGNNSLSSIDLRGTSIEGGRPANLSENNNLHGRRYIMWNDTFEDAQNINTIRIQSNVLGRNIGEYDSATQTFSKASFEGSTFNLPLLSTLEILCPEKRIRGEFFDPSQAPSLSDLRSYSTGWGLDVSGGTTCPSFAGNPNIKYVDLRDNAFSGNLALTNLPQLEEFYISSNQIDAITGWSSLPKLEYLSVSSNPNLGPDLPNFGVGSPNIRNLALNNCNFTNYIAGTFAGATRLRVLDLSNNNFNSSTIDTILTDLISNYNNAPRSGVIINLKENASPTVVEVQVPTVNTSLDVSQTITVNQSQYLDNGTTVTNTTTTAGPDGELGTEDDVTTTTTTFIPNPLDAEYIFGSIATGTRSAVHEVQINLRNDLVGTQSQGTQYETRVYLNNVELNSDTISIDYATNTITFLGNSPGNVTQYPPHNSQLRIERWKTVYGFRTEIEGGVTLVTYLTARGWTVRTE